MVTVLRPVTLPALRITCTALPGVTPVGTCTLICMTPATKPGCALISNRGILAADRDGKRRHRQRQVSGDEKYRPLPRTSPVPVAKIEIYAPRAAGFAAEFTEKLPGSQFAPCPDAPIANIAGQPATPTGNVAGKDRAARHGNLHHSGGLPRHSERHYRVDLACGARTRAEPGCPSKLTVSPPIEVATMAGEGSIRVPRLPAQSVAEDRNQFTRGNRRRW